jgi:hypothetical protein
MSIKWATIGFKVYISEHFRAKKTHFVEIENRMGIAFSTDEVMTNLVI